VAIDDVSKIQDIDELVAEANWLLGKTLFEIVKDIQLSDNQSRVTSKAGVGHAIETGFFGIKRNNVAGADITHLDVEIKTCPLKYDRQKSKLTVKEPLSLNIINYVAEASHGDIRDSSLYKKNKKILFIFYIHETDKPRSEYTVKYVFMWEMTDSVLRELQPDYDKIIAEIRAGKAHEIHQTDHKYLTLCPKHGGKFSDPLDKKSKTKQPYSDVPAEVRAYRFKSVYMNKIIEEWLNSIKSAAKLS